MSALIHGELLFVHSLRRPGLVSVVIGGALVLLSLSAITAFELGRELLMVREAAFGTLYLFAFLSALGAVFISSGQDGRNWTNEALARPVGKGPLALSLILHPLLVALWTALFLTPFLVASIALFHNGLCTASIVPIALGILTIPASTMMERTEIPGIWAKMIPPFTVAVVASLFLPTLPGGIDVLMTLAYSVAPIALVGVIPGLMTVILPGPGGSILALGLFILANMQGALSRTAGIGWLASMLPDLGGLNPSLVVSRAVPPGPTEIAGVFAYATLFGLAAALIAMGTANLRESGH